MKYAAAYAVTLVVFVVVDALWLGVVARSFYMARMGDLLLQQPRWGVAIVFYLLYAAGLVYFAVAGGLDGGGWKMAALNGALFGFFCYLTYDATNLAVLKGYDPLIAMVDVAWGTLVSAFASVAAVVLLGAFWRGG